MNTDVNKAYTDGYNKALYDFWMRLNDALTTAEDETNVKKSDATGSAEREAYFNGEITGFWRAVGIASKVLSELEKEL